MEGEMKRRKTYEEMIGYKELAIGDEVYVEIPFVSTDGSENLTIINRSKAIPTIIWKRNFNSGRSLKNGRSKSQPMPNSAKRS